MVDNTVIYIKDSAHHLDLRTPNPADPPAVTDARALETSLIRRWVEEYQNMVLP
jgi:hypothetical protein